MPLGHFSVTPITHRIAAGFSLLQSWHSFQFFTNLSTSADFFRLSVFSSAAWRSSFILASLGSRRNFFCGNGSLRMSEHWTFLDERFPIASVVSVELKAYHKIVRDRPCTAHEQCWPDVMSMRTCCFALTHAEVRKHFQYTRKCNLRNKFQKGRNIQKQKAALHENNRWKFNRLQLEGWIPKLRTKPHFQCFSPVRNSASFCLLHQRFPRVYQFTFTSRFIFCLFHTAADSLLLFTQSAFLAGGSLIGDSVHVLPVLRNVTGAMHKRNWSFWQRFPIMVEEM